MINNKIFSSPVPNWKLGLPFNKLIPISQFFMRKYFLKTGYFNSNLLSDIRDAENLLLIIKSLTFQLNSLMFFILTISGLLFQP